MRRGKDNNVVFVTAMLILACLQFSACAGSPLQLSKMSATEIQSAQDKDLCRAYALYKSQHKPVPTIDGEVARRNLTCEKQVEEMVSNCDALHIVSLKSEPVMLRSGTSSEAGTLIYVTVKNNSDKRKHFRVYTQNIESSRLTIGAGAITTYNIIVRKRISAIGSIIGEIQGTAGTPPSLTECVTAQ